VTLSSTVKRFLKDDGSWDAETVIDVVNEPLEGRPLEGGVPGLVSQLWLGGLLGKDEGHPKAGGGLTGGPQMLQNSLDGERVYVSNSLYSTWDNQFYPDLRGWLTKLDRQADGSYAIDPDFFIDFAEATAAPAPTRFTCPAATAPPRSTSSPGEGQADIRTPSEVRCAPSGSKFAGSSQASKAARAAGHSSSSIEYQAVSRLRPLMISSLRKIPSKRKPKRSAAAREPAFSALHFHSRRRYPRSSKTWRARRKIASVAAAVRRSPGAKKMLPISIVPFVGSMRM
jgi:hypothetical protein